MYGRDTKFTPFYDPELAKKVTATARATLSYLNFSLGSMGAAARVNRFSFSGSYGKLGDLQNYPTHWRKRKRLKNIIDKYLRKRRKVLARMRSGT